MPCGSYFSRSSSRNCLRNFYSDEAMMGKGAWDETPDYVSNASLIQEPRPWSKGDGKSLVGRTP
jgi:hypothetical protein